MSELLEAALQHVPRTVPLRPNGKEPVPIGWPTWTATRDTVEAWWRAHPQANVGVRTGSGLAVLDVDPRHGGTDALAQLEEQHGALPDAPEVVTGSGGRHVYFTGPRDLASFDLAPGVEVKAAGCQVVAPPSVHPSGRLYVWHPARPFQRRPPALPAWIADRRPAPTVARTETEAATADPYRRIPAAVYVPVLTGQPLDRRGYVRCPLHGDDSTPSLRAGGRNPYSWFCFGCPEDGNDYGTGGGIYELAARMRGYRVPVRGGEYLAIRAMLARHFEAAA